MGKDFQGWHGLKSSIDDRRFIPFFREREIWWCSIGANVGVEEDGKNCLFERPVLIFRKFNREMFWGLPMTSGQKVGKCYHALLVFGKMRTVLLSQQRVFSGKRLMRRIGKMSWQQYVALNDRYKGLFNETDPLRDPRVPSGNSGTRLSAPGPFVK